MADPRRLTLDAAASRIVIHTFAEGLFSRLAHDLEIEARDAAGYAEGDRAELEVPVAGLRVAGAVKRGKVDAGALSAGDRRDIEAQIRGEVLGGGSVRVEGTREGARARVVVTTPKGTATFACDATARGGDDEAHAEGRCDLSLRALGVPTVKGPMGAFRLSDRVEVVFRLVFRG